MSMLYWLLGSTTAALVGGCAAAEFIFRGRRGLQDATWRYTLLVVACLPTVIALRPLMPKLEWETPIAFEQSPVVQLPPDPNLIHTSTGDNRVFANHPSPAETPMAMPTAETLDSNSIVATAETSRPTFGVLFACIWAAVALYSLCHLFHGWWKLRRFQARSAFLTDESWRRAASRVAEQLSMTPESIRLRVSDQVDSPVIIGICRPAILLPQTMVDQIADPNQLETLQILSHEAMHLRRRDPLWNLLLQTVVAFWWPHPLVHLMRRRMCWLRELLCDAQAALGGEAESYAETLLDLASGDTAHAMTGLAIEPPRGTLESRVRWILSRPTTRQLASFNWVQRTGFAVAVGFAFVLLVGIRPAPFAIAQSSSETKPLPKKPAVDRPAEPIVTDGTFAGRVLLPDDGPAIGATVYLRKNPRGSITLPTNPRSAVCDFEGRYRFESIDPGPYRVWAETDEYTTLDKKLGGARIRVEQNPPSPRPAIDLRLHPGCGYDVGVFDASGNRPIQNATISFGWTDIDRSYATGADGVAEIRNLGVDDWYFIVRADGYATVFKKTSEQQLGSVLPMRFDLEPGGVIVGTVRDQNGKPVPEANVSVSPRDQSMTPRFGRTTTDEKGNYRLDGLPIGRPLRVSAGKDGYQRPEDNEAAVATAQSPTVADFTMKKSVYGGDVMVTVADSQGRPVVGASLLNQGDSSAQKRVTLTDVGGRGLLQNVYTGYAGCHVVVKAEGYVPQRLAVTPGTIDAPAELKVKLKRGNTVSGIIVRPDGSPAPGLRVYFNGGHTTNVLGGRVNTDSDGRFELTGLPDRSTITVYTPREFAPIERLNVPVGKPGEFRIQMSVAGVLRIRAVDAADNQPIEEFNVKIGFCETRRPDDPSPRGISSSLVNPGVNIQGTKKEYRLDGQAVGTPYKVIVAAKGYETETLPRVEAQRADTARRVDVPLKRIRPEDYQTVAGRLLHVDGTPIAGAQVRLLLGSEVPQRIDPFTQQQRRDGWRFYHWGLLSGDDIENRDKCVQLLKTASDSDGKFRFDGVKKGTPWMELFYFGNGLMSQRYNNLRSRDENELTQLKFTAQQPSRLIVRVDRGKYPEAYSVTLAAEDYTRGPNAVKLAFSRQNVNLEDHNQPTTFSHLPSGDYVVRINKKPILSDNGGYMVMSLASQKVRVPEGEQLAIGFE